MPATDLFTTMTRDVGGLPFERKLQADIFGQLANGFFRRAMEGVEQITKLVHALSRDKSQPEDVQVRSITEAIEASRTDGSLQVLLRGAAGGIKVRDLRHHLFYKVCGDRAGIYGGSVPLRSKSAKNEAQAMQFVHRIRSCRATAALSCCIDCTQGDRESEDCECYRVQVFTLVPGIGDKTIRMGSNNAGRDVHICPAVFDLATWLAAEAHLAPSTLVPKRAYHVHQYHTIRHDSRDAGTLGTPTPAMTELLTSLGCSADGVGGLCQSEQYADGLCLDPLRKWHCRYSSFAITSSLPDAMVHIPDAFKLEARADVSAGPRSGPSGANGSSQHSPAAGSFAMHIQSHAASCVSARDRANVAVANAAAVAEGGTFALPLPFDVEMHVQEQGEVILSDVHRLLVPDVQLGCWSEMLAVVIRTSATSIPPTIAREACATSLGILADPVASYSSTGAAILPHCSVQLARCGMHALANLLRSQRQSQLSPGLADPTAAIGGMARAGKMTPKGAKMSSVTPDALRQGFVETIATSIFGRAGFDLEARPGGDAARLDRDLGMHVFSVAGKGVARTTVGASSCSPQGRLLVMVADPQRYWRASALTALFRSEATAILRRAACPRVSPDLVLEFAHRVPAQDIAGLYPEAKQCAEVLLGPTNTGNAALSVWNMLLWVMQLSPAVDEWAEAMNTGERVADLPQSSAAAGKRRFSRELLRQRISCRVSALLSLADAHNASDPFDDARSGKNWVHFSAGDISHAELEVFETESEHLGWQTHTLLCLRAAVKAGLHRHGLGLRHCWLVHHGVLRLTADAAPVGTVTPVVSKALVQLAFAASCLPRPGSPNGLALEKGVGLGLAALALDLPSWRSIVMEPAAVASRAKESTSGGESGLLRVLIAAVAIGRALGSKGRAVDSATAAELAVLQADAPWIGLSWLRSQLATTVSAKRNRATTPATALSPPTPLSGDGEDRGIVAQVRLELRSRERCGIRPNGYLSLLRGFIQLSRHSSGTFSPVATLAALKGLALSRGCDDPRQLVVWAMLACHVLSCSGHHTCALEISGSLAQLQEPRGCAPLPEHVVARSAQASSLTMQGKVREGLVLFAECARLLVQRSGRRPHASIGILYCNMSSCYRQIGQLGQAHEFSQLGIGLMVASGMHARHPLLLSAQAAKVRILLEMSRPTEAIKTLRELGPALVASFGPDHAVVHRCTVYLGRAFCDEAAKAGDIIPPPPHDHAAGASAGVDEAGANSPALAQVPEEARLKMLARREGRTEQMRTGVLVAFAGLEGLASGAAGLQLARAEARSHLALCLSAQGRPVEAWLHAMAACRGYCSRLGILHPSVEQSLTLATQLALRCGKATDTVPLVTTIKARLSASYSTLQPFAAIVSRRLAELTTLTELQRLDQVL